MPFVIRRTDQGRSLYVSTLGTRDQPLQTWDLKSARRFEARADADKQLATITLHAGQWRVAEIVRVDSLEFVPDDK